MPELVPTTAPRPFVFVLMPFHEDFDDVYKLGIKQAAEDAGAYAERVDDQHFDGVILERIRNQIAAAHVLVADVTGRNSNVAYEVGYAHALGKLVVLLARDAKEITFDLNQHLHIIYEGKIALLKEQLTNRLRWAIEYARRRPMPVLDPPIELRVNEILIPPAAADALGPQREIPLFFKDGTLDARVVARNVSPRPTERVTHLYALLPDYPEVKYVAYHSVYEAWATIAPMLTHHPPLAGVYTRRFRVADELASMPPFAMETVLLQFRPVGQEWAFPMQRLPVRFEVYADGRVFAYDFVLCPHGSPKGAPDEIEGGSPSSSGD